MSQYGMQMPGGRGSRAPSPDVYTGLMFIGVAALATACVFVWLGASKVAPDGQPWQLQDANRITLPAGR